MAKTPKNKHKNNNHPSGKKLKNPQDGQKRKSSTVDKSLNSLKKIQHQLDDMVTERNREKKHIKALSATLQSMSEQLQQTASRLPKLAANKDLNKLKRKLKDKSHQFLAIGDKLSREMASFADLNERVNSKILALEKASEPSDQQIQSLTQNQEQLFNKISHFENELSQFNSRFIQSEQLTAETEQQLLQLDQFISQAKRGAQAQDSLIKLLQADTANIRKSLQQIQGIDVQIAGLIPKLDGLAQQQQQLSSRTEHLEQQFPAFEQTQQQIIKPLQTQFRELELGLQSLHQDYQQQQKALADDNGTLAQLIPRFNQFEQQVHKTQDELKQHFQQLIDSEHQSNSEQLQKIVAQLKHRYQEQDTQIKLLQAGAGNITNSLQRIQGIDNNLVKLFPKLDAIEQDNQQLMARTGQLDKSVNALQQAQQQLTGPLESQVHELEQSLQSLHKDIAGQQQSLSSDSEQLLRVTAQVKQFDEQLQQSQDELRQQLQTLLESEQEVNSQQFGQLSKKLEQLSRQLTGFTEQSHDLKSHFNQLQEQQHHAARQQDELSARYLTQQQQMEDLDKQLNHLSPLTDASKFQAQRLDKLADDMERVISGQQHLSKIDQTLQDNLSELARKQANSHNHYQKHINKLEIVQQEQKNDQEAQLDGLNHLGRQIKNRSLVFAIALVAVLGLSTLLFFNQQVWQDDTDRQALVSAIKSDIQTETFSKINTLTKQNSAILQERLTQLSHSIEQVRQDQGQNQQANWQNLQNNWQNQHQLLQQDISDTQAEQQALKLTVTELSNDIKKISDEWQRRQQSLYDHSATVTTTSDTKVEVTQIHTISQPFYGIQLLGAFQEPSLQHFLVRHNLSSSTRVFQTEYQGKPWYILIYGHYQSFSQASEQISQLPEQLLTQSPWVRKLP